MSNTPWNKGLRTGPLTLEHRTKIGSSLLGIKRSVKTRKKMSRSSTGRTNFLGHTHSVSTRLKMSLIAKNRHHVSPSVVTRIKMGDSHRGQKSHFWLGGITAIGKLIRSSLSYKLWHDAIFKRDDWTCVLCPNPLRGGVLHVDHIKPFFIILREENISCLSDIKVDSQLWDISNGRTLCVSCHKKTDSYLSKSKCF